jgi:hypothetical protein
MSVIIGAILTGALAGLAAKHAPKPIPVRIKK